ncbi:MAG: glycosyltransferase family 4 protein [Propionicimonas sp.]
MRVVHLLASLRPSGMERMLVSAAPYFAEAGVESVVVGQGLDHPFAEELGDAGYRVRTIPWVKSTDGLRAWMRLIREERPHVVHIHTEGAFALSVLAARRAAPDARIVRTLHSFFLAEGWWGVKRRAQAMASDRFVDAFVALGEEMARHEASFGRECVVIPNWVADRFLEVDPGGRSKDVDIALVGSCAEVKRHDIVLGEALANGWTVAHLGHEGEMQAKEREQLAALASAGLLRQRGVADPLRWLLRSHVYAMPSEREGFPVALAEAISLGAVCVVASAPGFDWAMEYPLVFVPKSEDGFEWGPTLKSALDLAHAPGTPALADAQRDRARAHLAARIGAEKYVGLYRGDSAVGQPTEPASEFPEAVSD